MSNQCHHILQSGQRCRAHAIRNTDLCYFHTNLKRVEHARVTNGPLPFAPLEDLRGIQLAVTQVFNLLDDPYADTDRMRYILRTLELATQIASRIESAQHKQGLCPHCGQNATETPEPPEIEMTDMDDFLPNRISLYPDAKVIESSTLPVHRPGQLPPPQQQLAPGSDPIAP